MKLIRRNDAFFPTLWEDFFDRDWFNVPSAAQGNTSVPAVNIKETEEGYAIEMAAGDGPAVGAAGTNDKAFTGTKE